MAFCDTDREQSLLPLLADIVEKDFAGPSAQD
jgi:hypothetical protein